MLGAVIITGYLGGAIAIQWRSGNAWMTHVMFGVYVGAIMWAGVWLRSARLRSVLPILAP